MVEVLFQTFSPIKGNMIKIGSFHYKVGSIFIKKTSLHFKIVPT